MIGLLFLATVTVWLVACIWLANKVGAMVATPRWEIAAKLVLFLILISLPFVDEVIGKYQFETLCKAHGIETADVSKARDKKVKVEYGERRSVKGTVIPIKESDVIFKDSENGEVLIHHKNYYASGGWVMRYTWLSLGSNHPMLFDSNCIDFATRKTIFSNNNITQLN